MDDLYADHRMTEIRRWHEYGRESLRKAQSSKNPGLQCFYHSLAQHDFQCARVYIDLERYFRVMKSYHHLIIN